jgi:hypothetical protein
VLEHAKEGKHSTTSEVFNLKYPDFTNGTVEFSGHEVPS